MKQFKITTEAHTALKKAAADAGRLMPDAASELILHVTKELEAKRIELPSSGPVKKRRKA